MADETSEVVDRRAEHYRALARAIFSLVSSAKSAEARDELEALATDYELLASFAQSQRRGRIQRGKALTPRVREPPGYWLTSAS